MSVASTVVQAMGPNAVVEASECGPEKRFESFISMGAQVFHRLLD